MHAEDNFSASEADLRPLDVESNGLPGSPLQICDFCGKLVTSGDFIPVLERLAGPGRFFCGFCVRHRNHTKLGRQVLAFSFRGLVAYLYYETYVAMRLLSFSELEDRIAAHVRVGLDNPVFSYDPETLLWHVDFSRIGDTKKKLPIEYARETMKLALSKLTLPTLLPRVQWSKLEDKYVEAFDAFYQKRARPHSHRLLIPTLKGCVPNDGKTQLWDKHKEFVSQNMRVFYY